MNDGIDEFRCKLITADAPISQRVALEQARMRAICDEMVDASREALDRAMLGEEAESPRVITRVMDDGIKTKDGAA